MTRKPPKPKAEKPTKVEVLKAMQRLPKSLLIKDLPPGLPLLPAWDAKNKAKKNAKDRKGRKSPAH